jgi:phosphatidate cytidylyltransferase
MFLRISPKKTWEGFFGGLIFSLAVALVFHHFSPESSVVFYLSVASLCSIWATVGDLIQSKFKRLVNVKDSGSLIPGHGGFFDRMDSVIFSAPWIYLLFNFKDYVS